MSGCTKSGRGEFGRSGECCLFIVGSLPNLLGLGPVYSRTYGATMLLPVRARSAALRFELSTRCLALVHAVF